MDLQDLLGFVLAAVGFETHGPDQDLSGCLACWPPLEGRIMGEMMVAEQFKAIPG
jgi:hypothetical protein